MEEDTKVVAHEGMNTDTSIFYKCRYGDGHCNILPIRYPLPFLEALCCIVTRGSEMEDAGRCGEG